MELTGLSSPSDPLAPSPKDLIISRPLDHALLMLSGPQMLCGPCLLLLLYLLLLLSPRHHDLAPCHSMDQDPEVISGVLIS